jgi:hypothetical protein
VVKPLSGFNAPQTNLLASKPPAGGGTNAGTGANAAPTEKPLSSGLATPMLNNADLTRSLLQMIGQLLAGKSLLSQKLTGIQKAASTAKALPQIALQNSAPAAGGAGNAGNSQSAGKGNGSLKIVQIDNFSADNTGFNHGQEMAKVLKNGGGDQGLAGKVDLDQYNVAGGNTNKKASDALRDVLQRVRNGEQVDAVHMPLQAFQQDGNTQEVKQLIEQLSAAGVPVVVAAGNEGPGKQNTLTGENSFNVQSATNGKVNGNSGKGNVTAEGRTTSFASANLAPILAAKKNAGLSLGQMKNGA